MIPNIAVILINYNGDNDTLECIKSLLEVSYENISIVVVDNASKSQDEFEKKIPSNVVFIKSDVNLGFAGGNNLGVKYAIEHGSDYVVLLNNDTVVDRDFLSNLVELAEKHTDAGIITGKILYYDSPDYVWFAGGYMNLNKARIHHYHIREKNDFSDTEKAVSFATGCLMMIPRSVIAQVGTLDESFFMYSEDAEYCQRIMKNGLTIWYTPKSVIYHKVSRSSGGAGSKLSQYYRTRNEMYLVTHYADHAIWGCLMCLARFIKRILVGQFSVKCVYYGLVDCMKNKMGKTSREV